MAKEILVTQEGYDKIKKELEDLKGHARLEIAEAIREAKSHGDLKENAAYHEAKLNQTRLESRISDLERAFQYAKVVERPDDAGDTIALGSKARLLDLEFDDELTVTLVGAFEADAARDLISINSPLGEALVGNVVGNEISVASPGGINKYRILEIQ